MSENENEATEPMGAAEVDDFCLRLKQFRETLSAKQCELLNRIFSVAWNATEPVETLEHGFAGSFTPDQADLIRSYQPSGGSVTMIPRMIRSSLIKNSSLIK